MGVVVVLGWTTLLLLIFVVLGLVALVIAIVAVWGHTHPIDVLYVSFMGCTWPYVS